MENPVAYFNYIDGIELPQWVIDSCPQTGDCTNAIREFMQDSEVMQELLKIDVEQLKKELYEYGAWDNDELSNHAENLERILWIAIGQIWGEQ